MENDYVLKHDFGYGRETELETLNKLELRNIDDLKVYVNDALSTFNANINDNIVEFLTDNTKTKVIIETI